MIDFPGEVANRARMRAVRGKDHVGRVRGDVRPNGNFRPTHFLGLFLGHYVRNLGINLKGKFFGNKHNNLGIKLFKNLISSSFFLKILIAGFETLNILFLVNLPKIFNLNFGFSKSDLSYEGKIKKMDVFLWKHL